MKPKRHEYYRRRCGGRPGAQQRESAADDLGVAPFEQSEMTQQQPVLSPSALRALDATQSRLHAEYFSLPLGATDQVPVAALRQMLIDMVPETASRLSVPLSLDTDTATELIDRLFEQGPYGFIEVRRLGALIRDHLLAYTRTLARWDDWEPLELHGSSRDNAWVQLWLRCDDDAVACDYVGAVFQPRGRGRATLNYDRFSIQAETLHGSLVKHYGDDYRGMRLFILGHDNRPVERWLYNADAT